MLLNTKFLILLINYLTIYYDNLINSYQITQFFLFTGIISINLYSKKYTIFFFFE